MNCECGFRFSGPGEFRNCNVITFNGREVIICPHCGKKYEAKHDTEPKASEVPVKEVP